MRPIELYANYVLRELLPKEMKNLLPEDMNGTKNNTILLNFGNEDEFVNFITLCNKHGFKYRLQ